MKKQRVQLLIISVAVIGMTGCGLILPGRAGGKKCHAIKSVDNTIAQIEQCAASGCSPQRVDSLVRRLNNEMSRAERDNKCGRVSLRQAKRNAEKAIEAAGQIQVAGAQPHGGAQPGASAPTSGTQQQAGGPIQSQRAGSQYGGGRAGRADPQQMQNLAIARKLAKELMGRLNDLPGDCHRCFTDQLEGAAQGKATTALADAFMAWNTIPKLAPIAADCEGRYKTQGLAALSMCREQEVKGGTCQPVYNIEMWCKRIADARELLKGYFKRSAILLVSQHEAKAQKIIKNMGGPTGVGFILQEDWEYFRDFDKHLKDVRSQVSTAFRLVKATPPANYDAKLASQKDAFLAARAHALKTAEGLPKQGRPSKFQRFWRKRIQKITIEDKPISILRMQEGEDWRITRTGRSGGLPQYRSRVMRSIVRVQGEKYCRRYGGSIRQEYIGGGRFQEPGITRINLKNFTFIRCP